MSVTSVIKAVHDVDLERILRKLGLYEKLVEGRLHCSICGRRLSLENLGGIYRDGDAVKLVCNRIECLVYAAEKVRSSKSR